MGAIELYWFYKIQKVVYVYFELYWFQILVLPRVAFYEIRNEEGTYE